MRSIFTLALFAILAALYGPAAFAQDPQVTGDQDGSSQQVEESDEAYRRRMELEDARHRDPTYTDPGGTYQRDLEKIDKLPQESRENIRDQLVDIIMENSDWQPGDALEEYPYEPTEAAQANADLMNQEQEAWDEQIEKYHAREAAAFGAYRGPVEGPGNPDGQEGGSEGGQQGQQGSQGGQQGGQDGSEGSQGAAGTYQPYQSQSSNGEDSVSTDGVSESALDFLMNRQAGQPRGQAGSQSQEQQAPDSGASQAQQQQSQQDSPQQAAQQQAQEQSRQEQADNAEDSDEQVTETDMRGIIAIEDLDKLEGAVPVFVEPPEEEEPEKDDP